MSYDKSFGTNVTIPTRTYVSEWQYGGDFNTEKCLNDGEAEEDCQYYKEIYDSGDTSDDLYEIIAEAYGNLVFYATSTEVNITSIGEYAFGDLGITSVSIPDGITTFNSYAFYRLNYYDNNSQLCTNQVQNVIVYGNSSGKNYSSMFPNATSICYSDRETCN